MMCSPLHITANCMFHFHPLTFIEFRRVGSGRHEHRRGHARDFKETMPSEELHGTRQVTWARSSLRER